MQDQLIDNIAATTGLEPQQVAAQISRPPKLDQGDLAFPCFALAKQRKMSPVECATALAAELELPAGIARAEALGPYLNFFVDRTELTRRTIDTALQQGHEVGSRPAHDECMIVEYSSPNIAKPFHVGHLRTTLIGHSLVQIYRHLGYQVEGINHLGDWGTQFGFVFAGCELWGKPEDPDVDELVEIYKRATALRKAQDSGVVNDEDRDKPDVNQMARDYFVRLQAEDKDAVEFWQWCLDISMKYLRASYKRLGINFDHYHGESFYSDMLPEIEQMLRDSGILEESRGDLGIELEKPLGFVRIFAADGRSLYITRDIATAIYREKHFKPTQIKYVVAAQQNLHFKQLIGIMQRLGHPVADKMQHVSFGFVPGQGTRGGGAISLRQFLNEMYQHALDAYKNQVTKKPEGVDESAVAEAVAVGATYFYYLSRSNVKDLQFDWKTALNFQGDTGPYLQYAVARINGIVERAAAENLSVPDSIDPELIREDSAYELVSLIARFNEAVERAAQTHEPHHIAVYLLDLAKAFSRAYLDLMVIGTEPKVATARLGLFKAVQNVLSCGLRLIGVPCVERM